MPVTIKAAVIINTDCQGKVSASIRASDPGTNPATR